MSALRARDDDPLFAVRIKRGLVTHWGDVPLRTVEMADKLCAYIRQATGEVGEVERVVYHRVACDAAVPGPGAGGAVEGETP